VFIGNTSCRRVPAHCLDDLTGKLWRHPRQQHLGRSPKFACKIHRAGVFAGLIRFRKPRPGSIHGYRTAQKLHTQPSPHASRHVTPLLVTPLPVHVTTAPIECYKLGGSAVCTRFSTSGLASCRAGLNDVCSLRSPLKPAQLGALPDRQGANSGEAPDLLSTG